MRNSHPWFQSAVVLGSLTLSNCSFDRTPVKRIIHTRERIGEIFQVDMGMIAKHFQRGETETLFSMM